MSFKFSKCVCLTTPDSDRAKDFYEKTMGLKIKGSNDDGIEFDAGAMRFFLNSGDDAPTFAMEFIVPDLEEAKKTLVDAGCEVVKWEGKGKDCYIRDPYGLLFNLWEDPQVF